MEVTSVLRPLLGASTAGRNTVGTGRANSLQEPPASGIVLQICSEGENRTPATESQGREALSASAVGGRVHRRGGWPGVSLEQIGDWMTRQDWGQS